MPASARAALLFVAATLGQALSDFDGVRAMNDESMELYRTLKDDVGFYYAMGTAGLIAVGQGRHAEGLSMMEESGARRLEMGDKWPAAAMFGFSATVALGMGDRARARRLAERALAPLDALTPNAAARMTATLGAWLDAGGNVAEAARAIHVHPQTLRYRLRQLEELLGPALTEPDGRLTLAIAVRVRRVAPNG